MRLTDAAHLSCSALPGWSNELWDPRPVAASYATFAALLASLAIAGLIWRLQYYPESLETVARNAPSMDSKAIIAVWLSLIPLVISTLLSAEAAGEANCTTGYFDVFLATTTLAVGSVLLFVGVGSLLVNHIDDLRYSGTVISWTALLLASLLTFYGSFTVQTVSYLSDPWGSELSLIVLGSSIIGFVIWQRCTRNRTLRPASNAYHSLKWTTWFVVALLLFITLFYYGSNVFNELTILRSLIYIRTFVWAIFLFVMAPVMPRREPAIVTSVNVKN